MRGLPIIVRTAFRSSLLFSLLFLLSCEGKHLNGPVGDPTSIPFGLVIPVGLQGADYYAIAGTQGSQQIVPVEDSLIEIPTWRFYAQFTPSAGNTVDFDVVINSTKLQRHHDTDTLRLRTSTDTTLAEGEQIWHLRAPGEDQLDLTRFSLPPVTRLDTISPFHGLSLTNGTIRSDTALTIRWNPGSGGSIKIEWEADNGSIVRDAQDFNGSYTIPAEVMASLRGRGTVRVTRFRSIEASHKGKSILGIRMSQRSYDTFVQ